MGRRSSGVTLREASHLATLDVRASEGSLLVSSTGQSTLPVGGGHGPADLGRGRPGAGQLHAIGGPGRDQRLLEPLRPGRRRGPAARRRWPGSRRTRRIGSWPGGPSRCRRASRSPRRWIGTRGSRTPSSTRSRRTSEGPNTRSFPDFFSLDVVLYKSLTIARKQVKLNVQVFNVTNHFNPRDVFNTLGGPQFGTFTNSVGPTVRGDIAVNW